MLFPPFCRLENNTDYTYRRVYLRDIRPSNSVHIRDIDATNAVIFFDSNENQNDSDIDLPYLENRVLVWNIEFNEPKDIRIKIPDINLGDSDVGEPECPKDYLILYEPDKLNPTTLCTNSTNPSIQPYNDVKKFIIRFSSDEDVTYPRGFRGRIIVLNNISGEGWSGGNCR